MFGGIIHQELGERWVTARGEFQFKFGPSKDFKMVTVWARDPQRRGASPKTKGGVPFGEDPP